jgi:hypothetical protein
VPKGKAAALSASWVDCPACFWRNYKVLANANPLEPTMRTAWTLPATCGGCGGPLAIRPGTSSEYEDSGNRGLSPEGQRVRKGVGPAHSRRGSAGSLTGSGAEEGEKARIRGLETRAPGAC